MDFTAPTVSEFKSYFVRDFQYAPTDDAANTDYIIDADVTRAIAESQVLFNYNLFSTEDDAKVAFMYLAAHMLVSNIRNSSAGLNSQAALLLTSTSAGPVSLSYQLPDRYSRDPVFMSYLSDGYGGKYLEIIIPLLVGNVSVVAGETTVG